jgi:hypothetical protein
MRPCFIILLVRILGYVTVAKIAFETSGLGDYQIRNGDNLPLRRLPESSLICGIQ